MSVPDVELVSEWSEVDAAAQAIKNGVQKSQMSAGVQMSLGKADSALQGATGLPQLGEGRAVCNTAADTAAKVATVQGSGTFALREGSLLVCYFVNPVPAGATLNVSSSGAKDIFYNNSAIKAGMIAGATYALLQYNGTSDKWVLIATSTWAVLKNSQIPKTEAMTGRVGIDEYGQLWTILASTIIADDVKQTLLDCLAHVGWTDAYGLERYNALESALYNGPLQSISAAFDQGSAVIYDVASLDDLRQYLTVTAYYPNSGDIVVTGYDLSGTLTAGTSTITVTYGGKTTTFDVIVTSSTLYSLENYAFSKERIVTDVAILNQDRDFSIALDINITSTPSSGDGNTPKLIICVDGAGTGMAIQFAKASGVSTCYATWQGANDTNVCAYGNGRIRLVITHKAGSGALKVGSRYASNNAVFTTIYGTFVSSTSTVRFGGNVASQYLPVGTINKAYIFAYEMTEPYVNQFLGM